MPLRPEEVRRRAVTWVTIAQVSDFSRLLSQEHLRRLAGERSFERGAEYLAAGRVSRLGRSDEHVDTTVHGAHPYGVELLGGRRCELAFSCTCPMGQSGAFCKHCVAVGLALPESGESGDRPVSGISLDDVRSHLASMPAEELVELVIEEAGEDERLLDRLRLRTAAGGDGVDIAAFRDGLRRPSRSRPRPPPAAAP